MILEEIRSQNRTTIEAVEAARVALELRIERLEQESRGRDATLELAVRQNSVDIRQLLGEVRQLQGDVRGLTAKVEALARIEERVAALEKRLA